MRAALLLSTILVLLAPFSEGSQPVIPTIALTISPTSANATASLTQTVMVGFNGTATVQKLPFTKATVTLTCAVDVGWPASVTPSSMTFSSSGTQSFSCSVGVPNGTLSGSATLKVNGKVVGNGFQSTTSVTASITVKGVAGSNATAGNRTTNSTAASGAKTANALPMTMIYAVILVAVVICVGAFLAIRRRRTAPAPRRGNGNP